MAGSDSGEKTEEPTAKKLSDARKKGQIARSKDLGTMFVLMGGGVALLLLGDSLVSALSNAMKRSFSLNRKEIMDVHALFQVVIDVVSSIMTPFLWIHITIVIAAFIGNTLLGGMSFSWAVSYTHLTLPTTPYV